MKKIILSYSGGLDTSIMIKWLKQHYKGAYIIAYFALLDALSEEEIEQIKDKALKIGAEKIIIDNVLEEFIEDYILKSLQAGAVYQNGYLLSTALSRPLIAKRLLEVAREENATIIAHGSTKRGNDQVRFEVSINALMRPTDKIEIIAPAHKWQFKTREEEIKFAKANNIPIEVSITSPYSIDKNIWGVSIECGALEDIEKETPRNSFIITKPVEETLDEPTYIDIYFEDGRPVRLNNKKISVLEIIKKLNKIGGMHGVGRIDMMEDRIIGVKSREVYEAPAASILYKAYEALESLVLDKESLYFKNNLISKKYAELVYNGWWYSLLREALDAFINILKKRIEGNIKIKLYKGNIIITKRESKKYSLYNKELISYGKESLLDKIDTSGFIKLWGLPIKNLAKNL